jgi:hypothetical protein
MIGLIIPHLTAMAVYFLIYPLGVTCLFGAFLIFIVPKMFGR